MNIFFLLLSFPSIVTFDVKALKNRPIDRVRLCTHSICLGIKHNAILFKGLTVVCCFILNVINSVNCDPRPDCSLFRHILLLQRKFAVADNLAENLAGN